MRSRTIGMALALATALALGCSGSGPSAEELTGTWNATQIVYTSTTGLGSVDIMDQGARISLQLNADKSGVFTFTRVGGHVDKITGTWEGSIDVLTFSISATNNWQWDMSMSGAVLTLSADGTSWDFNDDGAQEPASWKIVLTKS